MRAKDLPGLDVQALPPGILKPDGSLPDSDSISRILEAIERTKAEVDEFQETDLWAEPEDSPKQRRVLALEQLLTHVQRIATPEYQSWSKQIESERRASNAQFIVIWLVSFAMSLLLFRGSGILGILLSVWFAFLVPAIVVTILASIAAKGIVTMAILTTPFRILCEIFRRITKR